jgi:hypothetical protein
MNFFALWNRQLMLGFSRTIQGRHRKARNGCRFLEKRRFQPFLEILEERTLPTVNLLNNFTGLASDGNGPPDTCIAAGTTSYVETVNQTVSITPKATGIMSTSHTFQDFFINPQFDGGRLPKASPTSFQTDPTVVWDDQVNRFIVGDADIDPSNNVSTFDIAVSKSASPSTLTSADWYFWYCPGIALLHKVGIRSGFWYRWQPFSVS